MLEGLILLVGTLLIPFVLLLLGAPLILIVVAIRALTGWL